MDPKDKIVRFIDCLVPVTTCTLRCHYCYITHHRLFGGPLPHFSHTPEEVRRALSRERLGGTSLINFCGAGETLLAPNLVSYIRELLEEGHYVMIVTNATVTPAMEELAALKPELTKHLFFKFSYHYLQLKERGLMEKFFGNIKKVVDAGCSFTLEATPSDELIPYIDEMKQVAIEHVGAIPHISVGRDERKADLPILTDLSRKDYAKTWSVFGSSFFRFKESIFGVKRKEFCYAGDWTGFLEFGTGVLYPCNCRHFSQNIFEDPSKPIKFQPVGNNCREPHCYNGHAWLCLGNIPELPAPTYAEIRDRVRTDGTHWLQPEMASFLSTRLYETHPQLGACGKLMANLRIKLIAVRRRLGVAYNKITAPLTRGK